MRPIIFEQLDYVGGISRTETRNDYRIDIGGHRFYTKSESINQIWRHMLGKDLLSVSRLSRIYYNGKFFHYPFKLTNVIFNLGLKESIHFFLSYLRVQLFPYRQEKTFEEWVTNRFGRRLFNTFFKSYTEKVWGIPCQMITADWARQRIKGLSLLSALTNALLGVQNAKSLINQFLYPTNGSGMMWQQMRQFIEQAGGEVHLNSKITRIKCLNNRITHIILLHNQETMQLSATNVISSIPITSLVRMLDINKTSQIESAVESLSYRALLIINLIIDKENVFPDQWIYIHTPGVKVGRIQNWKNWSSAMVPDPEKSCIGMEYFCSRGDEMWVAQDALLVEKATDELMQLGFIQSTAEVKDGWVVRQAKAYPVYKGAYQQNLDQIVQFLSKIDNLQTVGRNGRYQYNNMDHSMTSGMLAANNIDSNIFNPIDLINKEEYLEEMKEHALSEQDFLYLFAKMDKNALGISIGVIFGLITGLATLIVVFKGDAAIRFYFSLMSQFYWGYKVTFFGAVVGFSYSFLCGFLLGWVYAFLRNACMVLLLLYAKKKTEIIKLSDILNYL